MVVQELPNRDRAHAPDALMARRGMLGLIATVAGALWLPGCGLLVSSASFRYRMRVEGPYSGSAVYEILAEKVNGPRLPEEKPGGSILRGEALVLETPSGPVFVLLESARPGESLKGAVMQALAPDVPRNDYPYSYAVAKRLAGSGDGDAKGELPRADWPMMVRFRDINDPKSVEQMNPAALGVTRIRLETTKDAVTTGIEKKFPTWFLKLSQQRAMLSGKGSIAIFTNDLADNLAPASFSTEIKHGN